MERWSNEVATNPDDDRFCPLCGVSLDLHDGPDTCQSAGMKADLLDQFYRLGKR
jgi:hypothetical protein